MSDHHHHHPFPSSLHDDQFDDDPAVVDGSSPHPHDPLPYDPRQPHQHEDTLLDAHHHHDPSAHEVQVDDHSPHHPDDDDDDDLPDHHVDALYAEAAAEAEAVAALDPLSNHNNNNHIHNNNNATTTTTPVSSSDVQLLQMQLAAKQAEIEALKKALQQRDRQLEHQVSQQSTTSLIGEAVLAQAANTNTTMDHHPPTGTTTAAGESATTSHSSSNNNNNDPNNISNLQQRWKARFQQLVCFKLKHGHCNVPKSYDEPLHAWVRKQRVNKQVRDKTGGTRGLTTHQWNSLQALDFDWYVGHLPKEDQWNANYQKLLLLSHEQGHLETTLDKNLNKWMQNQRARRKLLEHKGMGKAKGMTWERVQKLDAIGFRWDAKK